MSLYVGANSWLVHWVRSPNTPDLTNREATEILLSRPEFRSQGRAPSFQRLQRSQDFSTRDYFYSGDFRFVSSHDEQVNDAVATFQFQNGHWAFTGYGWGPPDKRIYMNIGFTEPKSMDIVNPKSMRTVKPYLPGVAWKRLPDGRYVKYDPNAHE